MSTTPAGSDDGGSFSNPPDEAPTPDPFPTATPAPPDPEPFLTDVSSTTATINTTGTVWPAILADPTLGLKDISSGGVPGLSSSYFWGLSFSSSANPTAFGNSDASAAVGDQWVSGVLGMVAPASGTLTSNITFGTVRDIFGITANNSPGILSDFLNAVDSTGALELSLDLSSGNRNALWAVPALDVSSTAASTAASTPSVAPSLEVYRVVVSLTFDIVDSGVLVDIENFLNKQYGISLSLTSLKPQIALQSITFYNPNSSNAPALAVSSTYRMTISVQIATFEVSAVFTPTDLELFLSNPENVTQTESIYTRLSNEVFSSSSSGSSTNPGSTALPDHSQGGSFNSFMDGINLWYVSIGKSISDWQASTTGGPLEPVYGDTYWRIGLTGMWQVGQNPQELLLGITYDSRSSIFSGRLLFSTDFPDDAQKRQYDYEWQTDIPYDPTTQPLPPNLDLAQLFGASKPPPQIPTLVTEAMVSYQKGQDSNSYTFAFSAQITSQNPVQASAVPSGFDWKNIAVNAVLENDSGSMSEDFQIFASFSLTPSSTDVNTYPAASLWVNLEYSSGGFWLLDGRVENLSLGLLYNYFDSSSQNTAVGILGKLTLRTLHMLYTFDTGGDASSFLITAALVLGELELDLYYQYTSAEAGDQTASSIAWADSGTPANVTTPTSPGWIFEAFLGATSPNSTVGSIAQSISPNAGGLPGFVANIAVNPVAGGNAPVKLKMQQSGSFMVVMIQVLLLDLDFTFVSISTDGTDTKHILRVSVDQIPLISTIPLIKSLPQPFDQLLYLWLDDDSEDGLSQTELTTINGELTTLNIPLIAVKDNNSQDGSQTSSGAVLQAGHHFMVVQKGNVILDHVFQNADSSDPDFPADSDSGSGTSGDIVVTHRLDTTTDDDPAPTKGNLDVQLPFLSISALTLQFKNASLYIDIDATMLLGPISFEVIGFEVVLHLTKVELNHLEDMLTNGFITFGIHGLAVSVDESPLEIAGIFIHDTVPGPGGVGTIEEYIGGISLGFEEWQFLAVGAYEIVTTGTTQYKSVFVYAKLDGPLVTLAFATVSGVRLGFGYNSVVRSPSMAELPTFPFLQGSAEDGSGDDPIKILNAITNGSGGQPWISPQEDSYWVVAGLTLTAFGILSATAVLMVGFQPGGVVIGIFADAIAQMPPDSDADATLFYIEIFMIAELNTVEGFFTVQASLAPSSHILVSSCRLTGGFALVNWFQPNTHTGDFVFTVGGFHPAYSPPAWYPVPARLGISFTLGSMINVTGTVYFAVTPKCVMGGGGLHMGLDVGPVSAWLDVALDVFIQFKPFHYLADLSVSVGCAITINVWFVHVRITCSVGAALHIQGPDPFGGTATVDFYLFNFTIHFGNTSDGPPPLPIGDFYAMVQTPGPAPAQDPSSTVTDPANTLLKFVQTQGIYPLPTPPGQTSQNFPNSGADTIWNSKAGTWAATIGCDFALSAANLILDSTATPATTALLPADGSTPTPIYSKPMHIDATSPISSTLDITIWFYPIDGTDPYVIGDFGGTLVTKAVPAAVWAAYVEADDPAAPSSSSAPAALTDPSAPTVSLCMGVALTPPTPRFALSPIEEFDATVAFLFVLGTWALPALAAMQDVLVASGVVYAALTPPARWAQVAADWTQFSGVGAPVLGGAVTDGVQSDGLLKMAAQTLGWDNPPPSGNTTTATATGPVNTTVSYMLNGAPPVNLIANLATQYNVLPRYSASGSVPVDAQGSS